MMRLILLALLMATAASGAPIVVVDGDVRGVPDGIYAPIIEARDNSGTTLATFTPAGIAVTDGLFEVELDFDAVREQLAAGTEVTIDVELDGLLAVARLGAVFSVGAAGHAEGALHATAADSLGTILPAELVQSTTVGTAGAVTIAFANVVAVPEGVADGVDNGNLDAVGAGLVVTGGALRVSSVTTAQLIDGTVATAALVDASFNSASVASLAAVDVAANTLTAVDFATTGIGSADVAGTQVTMFQQNIACAFIEGALTTSSTCTRRTCANGAGRVTCGTSTCQEPSSGSTTCSNTALGKLLFAP